MAKNISLVLLGYDDEQITEKQASFVDFTTNKIGGKAVSDTQSLIIHEQIINFVFEIRQQNVFSYD